MDTGESSPALVDALRPGGDARDLPRGQSTTPAAPVWNVWVARLGPPVAYLAAALYCYSGFVRAPLRRTVGGADGVAYAWYLEWTHQSIVHGHNPFISTALNAPTGVNLMWNTSLFLLGVLAMPLTATIGPFATVGVLFVLAPFLSASSAYLVFRRMSGTALGSSIGAALFGFGPFFVGHWGHLNLTFLPLFPPILLLLRNILVTQTRPALRAGVLLGVLGGLQLLISEEIVVLAVLVALPAVAVLALANPGEVMPRLRHAAAGLGIGVAVAAAISAVPVAYQLFGPLAPGSGVTSRDQTADVAALVRPSLLQRFASHRDVAANLHFPANGAENTAYLGWPLIGLCVVLCLWLIRCRDRFAFWWLPTAACVVALSLGSPISLNRHRVATGPWAIYRLLPLIASVKTIRFSLITLLLVGLLIAWSLGRMQLPLRLATAVVVLAALVPLYPVVPYQSGPVTPTPRFFSTSAVDAIPSGATTLVLPVAGFPNLAAMAWQIRAHLRFDMIGGYSVFKEGKGSTFFPPVPSAWFYLQQVAQTGVPLSVAQRTAAARSIRQFKIQYIVVTQSMQNFDLVSTMVARIGDCHVRRVSDVALCQIGT